SWRNRLERVEPSMEGYGATCEHKSAVPGLGLLKGVRASVPAPPRCELPLHHIGLPRRHEGHGEETKGGGWELYHKLSCFSPISIWNFASGENLSVHSVSPW